MLRKAILTTFVLLLAVATANADFYVVGTGGKRYKRTVVVSPVPGNPTASGAALLAAYNGVTGATAADPWLVKLEPGIYDLGATGLITQAYVDLQGSGRSMTRITGSAGPLLAAGGNVEVSDLSVAGSGSTAVSVAGPVRLGRMDISVTSPGVAYGMTMVGAEATLTEVMVVSSPTGGGAGWALHVDYSVAILVNCTLACTGDGPNNAIYCQTSQSSTSVLTLTDCDINSGGGSHGYALWLSNVVVTARGCNLTAMGSTEAMGVRNEGGGQVRLEGCRVTADTATSNRYGVYNAGSSSVVRARSCEIGTGTASPAANNFSVRNIIEAGVIYLDGCKVADMRNDSSGVKVFVGASQVSGTLTNPGYFTCVGAYGDDYAQLDEHCQSIVP